LKGLQLQLSARGRSNNCNPEIDRHTGYDNSVSNYWSADLYEKCSGALNHNRCSVGRNSFKNDALGVQAAKDLFKNLVVIMGGLYLHPIILPF
jgi:hypothetical protein